MRKIFAVMLALSALNVHASQIYKCVGADGKVSFGHVPCGGVLPESLSNSQNGAEPIAPASLATSPSVRTVYPAPAGSEDEARVAIAAKLKDPDSLQVRNVIATGITPDPAKWVVCGEYNARNSFGGYVGFHKFALVDGKAFLGGNDIEAILVNVTCK